MPQLDDAFLNTVGLGGLPATTRQELLDMLLERLEIQVGKRLTDQMSEAQLTEFETMMPLPQDTEEERLRKEQAAYAWLEKNFPHYKTVVNEEIEKLRQEVTKDAPAIRQTITAASQAEPTSPPPTADKPLENR